MWYLHYSSTLLQTCYKLDSDSSPLHIYTDHRRLYWKHQSTYLDRVSPCEPHKIPLRNYTKHSNFKFKWILSSTLRDCISVTGEFAPLQVRAYSPVGVRPNHQYKFARIQLNISHVSYRVKHSKGNSISTRAHVLFSIYLLIYFIQKCAQQVITLIEKK